MPTLTDSMNKIRGWSTQGRPVEFAQTASINFVFDGAGAALSSGPQLTCSAGFLGRLTAVRVLAAYTTATTNPTLGLATIEIAISTFTDFPQMYNMYGPDTTERPGIAGTVNPYKTDMAFDLWIQYISINDVLRARISAISGGITSLRLSLLFKRLPGAGFGSIQLEAGGADLVTAAGDAVILRQ